MLKTTVPMIAVMLAAGVAACDRHPAPAEGTDNGRARTGTTDPSPQAGDMTNTRNGTTGNGTDATGASRTTGGTTSSSPGRGGAGGIGGIGGTTASPVGSGAR